MVLDLQNDVRIGLSSGGPRTVRAHVTIHGRVFGVGFRRATREKALELGLRGWVGDGGDGTIQTVIEGIDQQVDALMAWCRQGPPQAKVGAVEVVWTWPEHSFQTFSISRSIRQAARLETDMGAIITTRTEDGERHVRARLQNMSAGGFNLLTLGEYDIGDTVMLSFKAPSGRIYKRLPCQVVRVKIPKRADKATELGASFLGPPGQLVDEINKAVNLLW